ncbi:MAG: hypothetical protein RLY78_2761 [Pseudomonadota bacterium]|jgi:uncharacterized SAM-binding protein YcdF (DUF218 family)
MTLNDLVSWLDIGRIKGVIGALLLPPGGLLLTGILLTLSMQRRVPASEARQARPLYRVAPWLLLAMAWTLCTPGAGRWLVRTLTEPPPALAPPLRGALRDAPATAIVVLGGGARNHVPEVQGMDLKPLTAERLRHGIWLARQTRLPILFSGGTGFDDAAAGPNESQAADRVARESYDWPLRWLEGRSRDTRENATYSLEILRAQGIHRVLLVTHAFHQQRAIANFRRAAQEAGWALQIVPVPIGLQPPSDGPTLNDLLPHWEGLQQSYFALHEWLGRRAGA